jgi:hypothetical protein
MLDNLGPYVFEAIIIVGTISLACILDDIISHRKNSGLLIEHPPSADISVSLDAVPEVAQDEAPVEPVDPVDTEQLVEQPEPPAIPAPITEPIVTPEYKRPAFDYRHEFWPSPRPVNFVKALVKSDHVQIEGRLSHGRAIELLASRAEMKPDEFLRVDPITYTKFFMPSQYNAAVLLGQSIQRLEDTIRRHQYLDSLRRHG